MGLFGDIEKAKVSLGGNYLAPGGSYLLYVDAVKTIKSRKNKDFFIVEFTVLKSNHPDCKPGSRRSWSANLTDHDAAMGNVKNFLMAAYVADEDQVGPTEADAAVSSENPLQGALVTCEVTNVKTKSGGDFSKHLFGSVSEEIQNKAEELLNSVRA